MKPLPTLSFTLLLSIFLLTSSQTGNDLHKDRMTTKLENASFTLENSKKPEHGLSEESDINLADPLISLS